MIKQSLNLIVLMSLIALIGCTNKDAESDCSQLVVENSWIREAPPGSTVLAGYLLIKNTSNNSLKITSASSQAFGRIEFHQTTQGSNGMKMQLLPELEIAANSTLHLQPGGKHMMLFEPAAEYKNGEKLNIDLRCGSINSIKTEFPVKKTMENSGTTHHHHQH